MAEKWIDYETAKKLLENVCNFLQKDKSKVADFVILPKEAVVLSLYSDAFFPINKDYRMKFKLNWDGLSSQEALAIFPLRKDSISSPELVPIFAKPISAYFSLFPDFLKPKHLFLINGSEFSVRKRSYGYYGGGYFYEINKEKVIEYIFDKISGENLNPTDCIIWISNPDGTFGEDFWEYVSGVILREKGYFISHYGRGGDLSAYYLPDCLGALIERGFIQKGCFVEELEMITRVENSNFKVEDKHESIVVEAESSDRRVRTHSENSGVGQIIHKYLTWDNIYSCGIVAGPYTTSYSDIHCSNEKCKCRYVGLISCDERGNPIFLLPKDKYKDVGKELELIRLFIKSILLKNLEFDEKKKLVGEITLESFFRKLLNLDVNKILDAIENKLSRH